jgi:hypothetical protein
MRHARDENHPCDDGPPRGAYDNASSVDEAERAEKQGRAECGEFGPLVQVEIVKGIA